MPTPFGARPEFIQLQQQRMQQMSAAAAAAQQAVQAQQVRRTKNLYLQYIISVAISHVILKTFIEH